MTESLIIGLPWPSKSLSPNARLHWATIAKAKRETKAYAFAVTKAARRQKIAADRLTVRITFFPPNRRARDTDNMLASMKAAFDGIAESIGVDDSRWQLEIAPIGEAVRGDKVNVELEWANG